MSTSTGSEDRSARYDWSDPDAMEVVEDGDGEEIDLVALMESWEKSATDASGYETPVVEGPQEATELPQDSVQAMLFYHGMPVVVETKQGGIRRGLFWKVHMPADYGYIQGVRGADGDELDCYIGSSPESSKVFVVDQCVIGRLNKFDEHKVMLGYHTIECAVEGYLSGHHKGKEIFMGVREFDMPMFRRWMATADLNKPCSF